MLCLGSDKCKILLVQWKSTEIEINAWSSMYHSCNQANFRLLTSPITDRNSQSSPDFLCLKRRKGTKRALENPQTGLTVSTYHSTEACMVNSLYLIRKHLVRKGDLNSWRRSGRFACSLTALSHQPWTQTLGWYATEVCAFFCLCCLALLWYELSHTVLEPGCNLNGTWLSYRPAWSN